jgi:hypothetical protein
MPRKNHPRKKNKIGKVLAFIILFSTVLFFVITASSARIDLTYEYSEEFIGWPSPFLHVEYEKAAILRTNLNFELLLKNYALIIGVVAGVRIFFMLLYVKKNHERIKKDEAE